MAQKKQKFQEPNDISSGVDDVASMGKGEKLETVKNSERFMSEGDDSEFESDVDLDDSDDEDVGDNVCAICDDGGDIICCDGPCLRSFHATKVAAAKSASQCVSLGFSIHEVKEIAKFYCWNCQYKQHQCFVCGQLGSSEGPSKEVFVCDVALCGRFYHPACAADLLVVKEEQAAFIARMQTGVEAFSCPLHKCMKCKKGDMKGSEETRLYGCRRCPRAWHKQCISDKITFYDGEDEPGIRGWEMDGTRFIYCLRHEIDDELGTPLRDHLVFPNGHKLGASKDLSLKKDRKVTGAGTSLSSVERARPIKRVSDTTPTTKKLESRVSFKELDKFKKPPPVPISHTPVAKKKSTIDTAVITTIKAKKAPTYNEDEIKNMLDSLVELSKKAVTSETVSAKLMVPFIYQEHTTSVKKSISLGKLESVLHALSKARECLIKGGIEEAECIFPEESIRVIERSKNKLRVYLAPVLHGMRYTSFGRHFTKIDKLKEVVNRLHWYVNPGDMVVDFCCGANDFSRFMFEKLEQSGKKCEYKNFDIIQPKHGFNFIKKDWLKVQRHELPPGDRLVMGLNPPFGVKAQLANTMVDHVLTFKPKIIILIVPKETRRLESNGYECIWEDPYLLSGQAFYFPGSVDINDKALSQENLDAPPLYLWSRGDWAARHRKIAAARGHDNFHDPNSQPLPEPSYVSPLPTALEFMPENREFGIEARKEQKTTVTNFSFINERMGSGEDSTKIMHEGILTTNRSSSLGDGAGIGNLESVLSPKENASDAGNRLEKSSSTKRKFSSSEKSALQDSSTPSHGKFKGSKQSKQGPRNRNHSDSSGVKSEQILRSESSRKPSPPLRERERQKYVRDRLEPRDLRKSPERNRLNEQRGFDSREASRSTKYIKEPTKSRDTDRNFTSGRHGGNYEERFLASDGRKSVDDRRTYDDRKRYEDSRPLDSRSYANDRMLESFNSLQELRMREEDIESLRRMEEFIKADDPRNFPHSGLNMELHEADHHQRSPLHDSFLERTLKPLESVRGFGESLETDRMTQTVLENLRKKGSDEHVDGSQLYGDGQNVDIWRNYNTRKSVDEESLGNRGYADDRRLEHLQGLEDSRVHGEDRRGYLEDRQRLDESRGLLHSAGMMDVLSSEMLARSSAFERLNLLTGPGQQLGDSVHLNRALFEHQRQPLLHQLHLSGLPFEAQRDHQHLAHNLLGLEMEREMLRRHSSGSGQTRFPIDVHPNISGQALFGHDGGPLRGLPGIAGTPGEASEHLASLLRREGLPIRDLPGLPNAHAESSLFGQGNFPLRTNLGFLHLPGESPGRLTSSFEHENAALRGMILGDNERHPLSLSGHDLPLNSRGLPPEILLRNASLGAPGLGHLQERLDLFNSPLYRNERYPGNN
ncbi:hypothetical protein O6H91_02G095200 [Diphasiastrum complanatum]|nr:hypothetical protein O6H91_02G095200 [Diphasiastrum complanatum]